MKKSYLLSVLLMFLSINSFANKPEKGTLNDSIYKYENIGWSFRVPSGWTVRSQSEIARVRGIGKQAMEKELKQDIPLLPTPLLYLHNGNTNRFTSDAVTYNLPPGNYEKEEEETHAMMLNATKEKGMQVSSKRSKTKIDGVLFQVYIINILAPDRSKILGQSKTFSSLINGLDFSMSYFCTNKKECNDIDTSIMESTFISR